MREKPTKMVTLVVVVFLSAPVAAAEAPTTTLATVTEDINRKMVKLFGPGGFQGLNSYGTGVLVSPDGYVLTVASPLLDTPDLLVHLADGRRLSAKVIFREPELDAALLKIENVDDLPA